MGYADRLQAEFDEITAGINDRLERAAAENRDISDDENAQIERDDKRRADLEKAIGHYTDQAARTMRVNELRGKIPAQPMVQRTTPEPVDHDAELVRDFPTPGHWARAHAGWRGSA